MNIKKFLAFLLTAVIVSIAATSCSDKEDESALFEGECIPADANMVMKIDMMQILANSGIDLSTNEVKFDAELKQRLSSYEMIFSLMGSYVEDFNNSIDLSEILCYGYNNNIYCVARLKNIEKAKKVVKDLLSVNLKEEGGYQTAQVGDFFIAISDKMVWLTDGNLARIKRATQMAKQNSFADLTKIAQWLGGDWTIAVVAKPEGANMLRDKVYASYYNENDYGSFGNIGGDENSWGACAVKLSGDEAKLKITAFDANQNTVNIGAGVKTIDPAFLKFAPGGTNLLAAFGGSDNQSVNDLLAQMIGGLYTGEGTCALAMSIPADTTGENGSSTSKDIETMIYSQMSPEAITEFKQLADMMYGAKKDANGDMVIRLGAQTFTVSNAGSDALAIGNYNIRTTPGATTLAQKLSGQRGAVYGDFNISLFSSALGAPYTAKLDGKLSDTAFDLTAKLVGPGTPKWLLTAICAAVAKKSGL